MRMRIGNIEITELTIDEACQLIDRLRTQKMAEGIELQSALNRPATTRHEAALNPQPGKESAKPE